MWDKLFETFSIESINRMVNYHHTSRVASCFIASLLRLLRQAWNPVVPTVLIDLFKILIAALWSLSRTSPQKGQLCTRTFRSFGTDLPQLLQFWLVFLGLTNSTTFPAYSALVFVKLQILEYNMVIFFNKRSACLMSKIFPLISDSSMYFCYNDSLIISVLWTKFLFW